MTKKDLLVQFCKENGISLEELDDIHSKLAEAFQEINPSENLVGKCYKDKDIDGAVLYYKVINNIASFKDNVSCLSFEVHPSIGYSRMWASNLVMYDLFYGIQIVSIDRKVIETLEEIGEDEFNQALINYTNELITADWSRG